MTVTAPPRPPEPPARDDLEALIEEARGRARRRRLWYGACAALALLSGGLAWFLGHNGGGGPTGRAGSGLEPSSARPSAQPKPPPQFVRVARGYTAAEAGLVAPGAGWAMNGLGLYWTHDNGDHWRRITPPDVASTGDAVARISEIASVDANHLWVSASDIRSGTSVGTRHMAIDRTTDGGRTWHATTPSGCPECGAAHLSFVDARNGFALTGPLPRPRLFRTTDGGATWGQVASASVSGPLTFVNRRDGWVVSDPAQVRGGRLYRTHDGGHTWRPVELPAPHPFERAAGTVGLPKFFGARNGVVPVRYRAHGSTSQHVVVFVTQDGGASWSARPAPGAADAHGQQWGFPESLPFSAAGPSDWVLILARKVFTTSDAGRTWSVVHPRYVPKAPGAWDVSFTSRSSGWAVFSVGNGMALVRTSDGGSNWTAVALR